MMGQNNLLPNLTSFLRALVAIHPQSLPYTILTSLLLLLYISFAVYYDKPNIFREEIVVPLTAAWLAALLLFRLSFPWTATYINRIVRYAGVRFGGEEGSGTDLTVLDERRKLRKGKGGDWWAEGDEGGRDRRGTNGGAGVRKLEKSKRERNGKGEKNKFSGVRGKKGRTGSNYNTGFNYSKSRKFEQEEEVYHRDEEASVTPSIAEILAAGEEDSDLDDDEHEEESDNSFSLGSLLSSQKTTASSDMSSSCNYRTKSKNKTSSYSKYGSNKCRRDYDEETGESGTIAQSHSTRLSYLNKIREEKNSENESEDDDDDDEGDENDETREGSTNIPGLDSVLGGVSSAVLSSVVSSRKGRISGACYETTTNASSDLGSLLSSQASMLEMYKNRRAKAEAEAKSKAQTEEVIVAAKTTATTLKDEKKRGKKHVDSNNTVKKTKKDKEKKKDKKGKSPSSSGHAMFSNPFSSDFSSPITFSSKGKKIIGKGNR